MGALKQVVLREALYNKTTFSGTFSVIRGPYKRDGQQRDVMFKILRDGSTVRCHVWNHDYQLVGDNNQVIIHQTAANDPDSIMISQAPHGFDMSEANIARIATNIKKRFRVLDKLTKAIIDGNIRSLIISGAPGIGKTFTMENALNEAVEEGDISKFSIRRGRMSAIALFAALYEHKDEGDVLMLDDSDVFSDEDTLDLLKAALDTTKRRYLTWGTATTWLEDNGYENEFEFNGTVVFITNKNFDQILGSGSGLSVHIEALMSRGVYLDMGIHTKLEVMVRVDMVIKESSIIEDEELDDNQALMLSDWLWDHFYLMREISIRSVSKIAHFIKSDPDEWEDMAEVTQIKSR